VAFVAVLVALGELLDLGIFAYLLLTIPATAAFQLLVAGRRLEDLWLRDGPRLTRRTLSLTIAVALSVVPLVTLVTGRVRLAEAAYLLAAVVGAFAASYAVRNGDRSALRCFGLCMATAGLIGTLMVAAHEIAPAVERLVHGAAGQPSGLVPPKPLLFLQQWVIIFPVAFMMEEVTFRGAVDSHVHRPGERHGVLSAIFVSLLWALWHLPTLPDSMPLDERVIAVLPLQLAVGPFLSLWWRRSGNLAVTSGTHSFLDSVRNALGIAP
jgi:membrane protease YdiL (CAAX protease family)